MDKKEEFDLKFDFEKEFGFDPKELLGDEPQEIDSDFDFEKEFGLSSVAGPEDEPEEQDIQAALSAEFGSVSDSASDTELDELLSDDFLASLGIIREDDDPEEEDFSPDVPSEPEYEQPDFLEEAGQEAFTDDAQDFSFESEPANEDILQEPVNIYVSVPEPAFEIDPELGAEFTAAFEKDFPAADPDPDPQPTPAPVNSPASAKPEPVRESPVPVNPRRRKKLSKERIIKEVYLPPAIALLALILILTFIGGAIGRAVKARQDQDEALAASNEASSSALQAEVDLLIEEAEALASGYDYEAAIAKLDSFEGEMSKFPTMMDRYNSYTQARDKLVPFEDYASIPNLSFHGLIADPSRAFIDESFGDAYLNHYVTIDEFSKILQQLYDKGFVLVDFDSFIVETTAEDGTVTYSTQPLHLPEGKKPLMLTQTLVNYELFTVDSDGDGEADKGGDGFASKLVVQNGKIVNEMVNANGDTVYGAYDLVPILEDFIAEHPDFCYRGARAILAVTGEDGVFGYRTMHSVKQSKGDDYYNQQVDGAKAIAAALRDAGYTIACYTYGNVAYGSLSATKIQVDLDNWSKEVTPVLGEVPIMVYAKSSDISADGNYADGNKSNVLKNEGFRYFLNSATVPYTEVTSEYVRQSRIMVTGGNMSSTPSTYANYFDAASVLNELRGS